MLTLSNAEPAQLGTSHKLLLPTTYIMIALHCTFRAVQLAYWLEPSHIEVQMLVLTQLVLVAGLG